MLKSVKATATSKSGLICLQPFYFMEFATSGAVHTCCPAWIKSSIGNMRKNTISEIWNSDDAIRIREKMYEGQWQKTCNTICPRLSVYRHTGHLISLDSLDSFDFLTPHLREEIRQRKIRLESSPTVFNLANSKVCNLSCIMCARDSLFDNPDLLKKTADDIMSHLPTARRIIMSGMGDPFARPDTRRLLMNFHGDNPELKSELITNALLLPKYWNRIRHQRFASILISIDAATHTTYEKIRKGGSWDSLMESLSLIRENRGSFGSITINMTVMRTNYREIPSFIDFAESWGFNVSFQRIRGAWGNENIFKPVDKNALNELREKIMTEKSRKRAIGVFWGDLLEFDSEKPNREALFDRMKVTLKRNISRLKRAFK